MADVNVETPYTSILPFENVIKERQRIKLVRMIDIYTSYDDFEKVAELTAKLQRDFDNNKTIEPVTKPLNKTKKAIIEDLIASNPTLLTQKWYKIPEAIQEHLIRTYFMKLKGDKENKMQVMKEALTKFQTNTLDVSYDTTIMAITKVYGLKCENNVWAFEVVDTTDTPTNEMNEQQSVPTKSKRTRKTTTITKTHKTTNSTKSSKSTKQELEDLM